MIRRYRATALSDQTAVWETTIGERKRKEHYLNRRALYKGKYMTNTTDIFADDFDSHDELIRRLEHDTQVFQNKRIKEAFKKVDRKDFVRDDYRIEAYEDYPLPIGEGQTISQPTTVAFMLERLDPQIGDTVLDVGCGSGWTTALLAEMVQDTGKVIGLEVIEDLFEFGKENLKKYNYPWAEIRRSPGGAPTIPEAPFDRILVSAAANEIPQPFLEQLKDGGVMVLPINKTLTKIVKIPQKNGGYELEKEEYPGFTFVPFQDN